ncbi:hypothetical protein CRG98_039366 [Punica granatum]|uniref:Reverse transcriptase domain-containing protein n=1 Tax=Punica granatum TaxID=22663 RepID=A0A2I0I8C1_PUNGR|nr:hypothetical protein CRG98_039366 [Punica granatum]
MEIGVEYPWKNNSQKDLMVATKKWVVKEKPNFGSAIQNLKAEQEKVDAAIGISISQPLANIAAEPMKVIEAAVSPSSKEKSPLQQKHRSCIEKRGGAMGQASDSEATGHSASVTKSLHSSNRKVSTSAKEGIVTGNMFSLLDDVARKSSACNIHVSPRKPRIASQGVNVLLQNLKQQKGFNRPLTHHEVKKMVAKLKVNVVSILETRVQESKVKDIMGRMFAHWTLLHNFHYSHLGRIWILHDNSVTVSVLERNKQYIHCEVKHKDDSMVGGKPWVNSGDFDVVKEEAEASNAEDSNLIGVSDFRRMLEEVELQDHPWVGNFFTWSNKRTEGFIARKLDRGLVNGYWADFFPGSVVEFLNPGISDHCPSFTSIAPGQSPRRCSFRFYNFWTSQADYMKVVESVWSMKVEGYFHRYVKVRKSRNNIKLLISKEGERLEGHELIAKEAVGFYTKLLGTADSHVSGGEVGEFQSLLEYRVSEEHKLSLTKAVTSEEVKRTLWAMDSDKAPGPDGFNVHFYKSAWHQVGEDFTNAVLSSFSSSKLMGGVNRTCISLVPKKYASLEPNIFSVNGRLEGYFKGQKGVRQGDPLSPYLFVIAIEVLSQLLRKTVAKGDILYHPRCSKVNLTHLGFVDDLLTFLNGVERSLIDKMIEVSGFKLGELPVRVRIVMLEVQKWIRALFVFLKKEG